MAEPLLNRVLRVAEDSPESICMIDGDRHSSYGDLARGIRSFAATVSTHISPGDRVALLAEASLEYVTACYGTWLAGGVVVGLNAALRARGLANLVRHSGARVLAADPRHPELAGLVPQLAEGVEMIHLTSDPAPHGPVEEKQPMAPAGEDLAAVVYTSGTTGHPKGVMLSHGNISANTDSICGFLDIRPDDRTLCVLPFYYSFGASILNTHLVSGACLIVERSFMYPHAVLERAVALGFTSLSSVPSTYYLLLKRTDLSSFDLSSLRYCAAAGGGMDPRRIAEMQSYVPGADFFVMYGQTEATARLAWLPPSELERRTGSAGRAIPGVEFKVLGEEGREVLAGEVGEICARGPNVMMGYWRDPEETAEVLREGWLHTGDLGSMDEEGYVYLRGRAREMIKSGAHRIAPLEIEEVIHGVDGVEDVAVLGVEDEMLGQAVKACVMAAGEEHEVRKAVMLACRANLPLFKVPTVVEMFSDFPRTASGKVQKHLLARSTEGR